MSRNTLSFSAGRLMKKSLLFALVFVLAASSSWAASDKEKISVIRRVAQGLEDPDAAVRLAAVRSLGAIDDPLSVASLAGAVKDEDLSVRRAVLKALLEQGDPSVMGALTLMLDDTELTIRREAFDILIRYHHGAVNTLASVVKQSETMMAHYPSLLFVNIKAPAVREPLIEALKDPSARVRAKAAEALGFHVSGEGVVEALTAALREEDPKVLLKVIVSLRKGKVSAEAAAPLIDIIKAGPIETEIIRKGKPVKAWDSTILEYAKGILRGIRDPEALEDLLAAAADENGRVRLCAVEALANFKDPRALMVIIIASTEKNNTTLTSAAIGKLRRMKDGGALELFLSLLRDPDPARRGAAAEALRWVVKDNAPVIEALLAVLSDESPEVRKGASIALGYAHSDAATEALVKMLKDPSAEVRQAAAKGLAAAKDDRAVMPLFVLLTHENPHERLAAVTALGKIQDATAVEPLVRRLQDESPAVRAAAAQALGKIQDPRAVEPLLACLEEKNLGVRRKVVEALSDIADPRSADALLVCVSDGDVMVRVRAAYGLLALRDKRVIDPLIDHLEKQTIDQRTVVYLLTELTGKRYGWDAEKWRTWWKFKKLEEDL